MRLKRRLSGTGNGLQKGMSTYLPVSPTPASLATVYSILYQDTIPDEIINFVSVHLPKRVFCVSFLSEIEEGGSAALQASGFG